MKSVCAKYTCVVILFVLALHVNAQSSNRYALYLRTHQNKFFPGDSVFFKAYFLDANYKRTEGKHLLKVYLLDNKGKVVRSTQFSVLAGVGYNQLVLPDSLAEGFYTLYGLMNGVEDVNSIYTSSTTMAVVKDFSLVPSPAKSHSKEYLSSIESAAGPVSNANALITTERTDFKRRGPVKTRVQVRDADGKGSIAEFSVKVYNKTIAEGDTLFNVEHGNLFISTQTDPAIVNIKGVGAANSFQRTGKVYDTRSNEPVPDNTQVLFYLQGQQWHHQTFTLNGGSIRLNLPQFVGNDELFYLAESQREQIIPIRIQWEFTKEPSFLPAPSHQVSSTADAYAQFKKKVRLIEESYNAFDEIDRRPVGTEPEEFDLVEPDVIVKPDQFVKFENLAEMIREVIPGLYHRKHNEADVVRLNLTDPLTANSNPVYFIDGKATTDTKYFLSINPSEIDYVALVKESKKLLPFRLLGKNGIVIVKSKSGKYAPPIDDPAKIVEGLNSPAPISKPVINSNNDTSPVFRSTLYWHPSIVTDKDGLATVDFYTTDDIGEMVIEIEGITFGGQPFFTRQAIMVK